MEEQRITVYDHVDNIRAQFDKINKLAASLEDWERQIPSTPTEEHHIQAARGVLTAGLQMREALYRIERCAHTITEKHEDQADQRLSTFFSSKE